MKIEFVGPAGSNDYVTVTKPEDSASAYRDYVYTNKASPVELKMPLEAGVYEIRFVQGGSKVIAKQAITISAATASLDAKASAIAGESVQVDFTGPTGANDYVTVTKPEDPPSAYRDYVYSKAGGPASIRMPLEAGSSVKSSGRLARRMERSPEP